MQSQGARCKGQDQHQCKLERDAVATCNSNHHHYRPAQDQHQRWWHDAAIIATCNILMHLIWQFNVFMHMDVCTLHRLFACHEQNSKQVVFLPQPLVQSPLAPVVVSSIATCTSGVFPSTLWCRYQTYTRATCTVWWCFFVVVVVDVCYCGSGGCCYGDIIATCTAGCMVVFQSLYWKIRSSAFQLAAILILHCPYLGALKACWAMSASQSRNTICCMCLAVVDQLEQNLSSCR